MEANISYANYKITNHFETYITDANNGQTNNRFSYTIFLYLETNFRCANNNTTNHTCANFHIPNNETTNNR